MRSGAGRERQTQPSFRPSGARAGIHNHEPVRVARPTSILFYRGYGFGLAAARRPGMKAALRILAARFGVRGLRKARLEVRGARGTPGPRRRQVYERLANRLTGPAGLGTSRRQSGAMLFGCVSAQRVTPAIGGLRSLHSLTPPTKSRRRPPLTPAPENPSSRSRRPPGAGCRRRSWRGNRSSAARTRARTAHL